MHMQYSTWRAFFAASIGLRTNETAMASSALAATWVEAHAHAMPCHCLTQWARHDTNTSSCPADPNYPRGGNEDDSIRPAMTKKRNKRDVQCVTWSISFLFPPFFSPSCPPSLSLSFSPIANQASAHPVCWESLFSFPFFFAFVFFIFLFFSSTHYQGEIRLTLFFFLAPTLSLSLRLTSCGMEV